MKDINNDQETEKETRGGAAGGGEGPGNSRDEEGGSKDIY